MCSPCRSRPATLYCPGFTLIRLLITKSPASIAIKKRTADLWQSFRLSTLVGRLRQLFEAAIAGADSLADPRDGELIADDEIRRQPGRVGDRVGAAPSRRQRKRRRIHSEAEDLRQRAAAAVRPRCRHERPSLPAQRHV